MIITVTYIHLRKPWFFFRLSYFGYKIMRQAQNSSGFIRMSNSGFWRDHYTLSAWENEAAMKNFARSGEHLKAMKQSQSISDKLATYSYVAEKFPDWNTAKQLIHKNGKVLTF
ncbi:MAG TPA: hypothetical protein PLJ00_02600 [Chitinophagales bacterium]|nr:hypothetical protein [Chitinophagales bacterium]HRG26754.1 hypothetical protein [Chitinophagales bacterium]HRG85707.1 hypothetical protein [Chitinophagales bacterium]HRH51692.1 hypothetical protein [Chitinophagales bacterium]